MTNVWLPFLRSCEKFSVEEQFRLREDKTRITRGGQRQIVNRIVVNESATLPRQHVRILRAAVRGSSSLQLEGSNAVHIRSKRPGHHDSAKVLEGHTLLS
jgi:hypothetical protein